MRMINFYPACEVIGPSTVTVVIIIIKTAHGILSN